MHKPLFTVLAALLLGLAPAVPTALAKSPTQVLSDSTLATRTKAALADVNKTAAARLNVEVRKGKLQFGGFVETAFQKSEALRVGADMAGLFGHAHHQVRALDRHVARPVFDFGGDGQLATGLQPFDQHRGERRARCIDGGGIAGRAGPDNEDLGRAGFGHCRRLLAVWASK